MSEDVVTVAEREHLKSIVEDICVSSTRSTHMHYDDLMCTYNQARARGLSHDEALTLVQRISREAVANL